MHLRARPQQRRQHAANIPPPAAPPLPPSHSVQQQRGRPTAIARRGRGGSNPLPRARLSATRRRAKCRTSAGASSPLRPRPRNRPPAARLQGPQPQSCRPASASLPRRSRPPSHHRRCYPRSAPTLRASPARRARSTARPTTRRTQRRALPRTRGRARRGLGLWGEESGRGGGRSVTRRNGLERYVPPPASAAQRARATSARLTATAAHAPGSPPGKRYGRRRSLSAYFSRMKAIMTEACTHDAPRMEGGWRGGAQSERGRTCDTV